MQKKEVYVGGDIMSKGSQFELKLIEDVLEESELIEKFNFYSPRLNASINDKSKQTIESNNGLAERIVEADSRRLENSDVIIFNLKQHALGTITEIGQVYQMKRTYKKFGKEWNKKVFFLYDDIRDTELPETGFRRSFSINQYIYGCVLDLSENKGFITLAELKQELLKIA